MSDANDNVEANDANGSTTGFGTVDWSSLVIEENDDAINWNALEVLKRIPGISTEKLHDIQHTPNLTFSKMMHMNEDELQKLLGNEKSAKEFLHAINFEFK
jgi:DNA excision repair protein ERCC-4